MRINSGGHVLTLAGLIVVSAWTGPSMIAAPPAENSSAPALDRQLLSPTLQAREADAAWTELQGACHPPSGPAAWSKTPPTAEEQQKFYLPLVGALAGKMKDFYTRFPKDQRAVQARVMEFKFLLMTVSWGDTNKQAGLETAATSLLHDTALSEEDHVALLGAVAKTSAPEKARPWLQAAVRNAPSPKVKAAAEEQLKRFDGLGKPVELQFTAVDGRAVDLARFKGKVVLIDFWATWCPPCVAAIPEVKKIYDEFHPKGFEIVGINLDKDKSKLTQFVADNKMEWPQFFDGLFWQNKYARQFGIESIPTLWLIDKRGALRDLDALTRLSGEVPKLLAE